MLGREADDLGHVSQIVQMIEQRFEFSRRRHPEQRPRGLVGFVEIAMRDTAGHPNEISGLGLYPNAIEFEIQHTVLHQDELILRRMNVDRDKLAGVAVGLKGEGRLAYGLRKINLAEDVPGLARKPLSIASNAFLKRCHDGVLRLLDFDAARPTRRPGTRPVKQAARFAPSLALICCKNLKFKIYARGA